MGKTNKSNEVQTTSNLNFKKLLATTTLVAAGAMAFAGHAQAQAHDVWNLDQTAGSFSTDTSTANLTNIDVHTMNAVGSGDLDLPEAHTVNINQLDSSSRFVAIDTENDPTNILGRLNSNGALFILDENGVFFGENAVLNVGSIVASTGDILNQA